ncbi:MAG TPA: SPFH domain-containing protein [Polyangiaceae bacterium]|nr:SPFH domain-containing protein [Polyangiaceae bacterium]
MVVFLLVLAAFGILLIFKGFRVVQQSQCMVIERLGSYSRTLSNGLNLVVPFLDQPREIIWVSDIGIRRQTKLDLRETVLDVPEQSVITKDNVSLTIDALLYMQVIDPVKLAYEIANLPIAVSQLAQTSLRNVIGEMDLDETLASRDLINTKLKMVLDDATDKWGTKVNRVELKNITPPDDIQRAMEKQMQAERERRAKVLEAEGDKQARIARSEGQRQEQINLSDGDREAQIRKAQGEAEAIKAVAEAKKSAIELVRAALGSAELSAQYLVASDYLERFSKFTSKAGDKIYIPYEASTALGSLGSIKELIDGGKGK